MESADHGTDLSARECSGHLIYDIVRAAVGTAVEDDNPGVRLKHEALLMGKAVRLPVRFLPSDTYVPVLRPFLILSALWESSRTPSLIFRSPGTRMILSL